MLRFIPRARALPLFRRYATETSVTPSDTAPPTPLPEGKAEKKERRKPKPSKKNVGLRPTFRISVNPNHGLYGFFRKTEKDGVVKYDPLAAGESQRTGRSWSAAELRRKSFVDLHTLWYVLLRERNLCATQIEEGRRMGIVPGAVGRKQPMINARKCRKSMARIKYVLNERRLMYEGALQIFAQEKAAQPPLTVEEKKERLREELVRLMARDQEVDVQKRVRKERYLRRVQRKTRGRLDLNNAREKKGIRAHTRRERREFAKAKEKADQAKQSSADLATASLFGPTDKPSS